MGLAGVEHGAGEILQGSTAPAGIMFPSWPDSAFFRIVGGEPAMTLVPNLLVTGILAILFSLAFLAWAALFVERKNGGLVLILFAVAMLLAGGGIFPPVIGILIGILATRINAPLTGWPAHFPAATKDFLGRLWPWSFGACVLAWLCLFPGINILGYFFGVNDPSYTVMAIVLAFGMLGVTVFTGLALDIQRHPTSSHPEPSRPCGRTAECRRRIFFASVETVTTNPEI
jgi:hypothetical protein